MVTDPVCGMDVDPDQAEAMGLISEYDGETFYFCSPSCQKAFEQNPEAYLGAEENEV